MTDPLTTVPADASVRPFVVVGVTQAQGRVRFELVGRE
jgi:hypothetical protein